MRMGRAGLWMTAGPNMNGVRGKKGLQFFHMGMATASGGERRPYRLNSATLF